MDKASCILVSPQPPTQQPAIMGGGKPLRNA
jgi:hypothetical protein